MSGCSRSRHPARGPECGRRRRKRALRRWRTSAATWQRRPSPAAAPTSRCSCCTCPLRFSWACSRGFWISSRCSASFCQPFQPSCSASPYRSGPPQASSSSTRATTSSRTTTSRRRCMGGSSGYRVSAIITSFAIGAELGGVIGALVSLPMAAMYPAIERIWLGERIGASTVEAHERIQSSEEH